MGSIEPHEKLEEANKLSIRLARTGSRIVALPGHDPKTIRGFSAPRLIVVDEAAFVLATHAADDWGRFVETVISLRAGRSGWPAELACARLWYGRISNGCMRTLSRGVPT